MATIWVFLNHEDLRGVHVNTASLARLGRDLERVTLSDARRLRPVAAQPPQPVHAQPSTIAHNKNGTGRRYNDEMKRDVLRYAKAHGLEAASRHYAVSLASVNRWQKKAKAR